MKTNEPRITDINGKSVTVRGEKYAMANILTLARAQIASELKTATGLHRDTLLETDRGLYDMLQTIEYAD